MCINMPGPGFAAEMSEETAQELSRHPSIAYIQRDHQMRMVTPIESITPLASSNQTTISVTFKSGAAVGPAGYTWCSNEGGTCTLSGVNDWAFGANGMFTGQFGKIGSISCTTATFGEIAPGQPRACYFKPSSSGPSGYTKCAKALPMRPDYNSHMSGSPQVLGESRLRRRFQLFLLPSE
jgi:peptidase inhibitor I9